MAAPPTRRIVLLGAGLAHLQVLRRCIDDPLPQASLTCVAQFPFATYDTLVPAVIAGHQPPGAMEIDLRPLCRAAGASLRIDEVREVDVADRRVVLGAGDALCFDLLSIGLAAGPSFFGASIDESPLVVTTTPTQTLMTRLRSALASVAEARAGELVQIVVVGHGAEGVEIVLALQSRLRSVMSDVPCQLALVTVEPELVPAWSARTRRYVERALEGAGVRVSCGHRPIQAEHGALALDNGVSMPADLVVWSAHAAPDPLLAAIDLPKDAAGFPTRSETLQSTGRGPVFVVGGSAAPSTGTDVIDEGAALWAGIRAHLGSPAAGRARSASPRLRIMRSADDRGIAEWGPLSWESRRCGRLRDERDRRAVEPYRAFSPSVAKAAR